MEARSIQVLLAEDEPLAVGVLKRHLAAHPDLRLVGECGSGDDLEGLLKRLAPDLLLLDVHMPGKDVFGVLSACEGTGGRLPFVIFTTAYDRYAIRAFEVNAVDYLVKPFSRERFAQAVERVRRRLQEPADDETERLRRLIRDLGKRPERLLVPERGRMVPIAVGNIGYIRAEGDFARIFSGEKSYLVSKALRELEERLDPERFVRIHRSLIVNAELISEVCPEGSGRYTLTLRDGTRLTVSRTRAEALRKWML